jgi:hypothetical protein
MFSPKIVGSDAFLEMPSSTRELYFHLGMYADDDGFINPKKIVRMIGASEDDLKVLMAKRFVIPFENGVVVIKHWAVNNLIRKDWYQPTIYEEQRKLLMTKENGVYTEASKELVNNPLTEVRLGKVRLGKVRLGKVKQSSPSKEGVKDVVNYFFELKGWANKDKSFYKEKDVRYGHHAKRAKELMELCDGDVREAKECIRKMSEWASSKNLTWMIETVFKHWYDIDSLRPAEKKPYFDGCRIFQKTKGGKWWIVRNGEIKELGVWPRQEEIVYK